MPAADQTPQKWLAACHEAAEDAYRALPKGTSIKADNPHAVLTAIIERDPVPLTELAAGDELLWSVIGRGLAKAPDQRWWTMRHSWSSTVPMMANSSERRP